MEKRPDERLAQPSVIQASFHIKGPQGDYHVGHQVLAMNVVLVGRC